MCEYTNYCEGLDQKHKPVTCKLWDKVEPGDDAPYRRRQAPAHRAGLARAR